MITLVAPKEYLRRANSTEYIKSMTYLDFESICTFVDGIRKNGTESITFNFETNLKTYRVDQLTVVKFGDFPESWDELFSTSPDEIEVLEVRDFTVDDFDKITDVRGTYLEGENDEDWFSNVIE